MEQLKNVSSERGSVHVGGHVILMRQAYAQKGVDAVMKRGRTIADVFGIQELKELLDDWQSIRRTHGPKHCKKVQSRSAAFIGDLWLRKLIVYIETGKGKGKCVFSEQHWFDACEILGDICLKVDGPQMSHDVIVKKLSTLPFIGKKYGANHLIRCAHIMRVHVFALRVLPLDAIAWKASSGMAKQNTEAGFANLGVASLEEAHAAKHTLANFMGATVFNSPMTLAKYNKMLTIELPCAVCEWHGALMNFKKTKHLASEYDAARMILQLLPSSPAEMSKLRLRLVGRVWSEMSKLRLRLVGRVWSDDDVHTSLDIMRSLAVTKAYLKEQGGAALEGNALDALQAGELDLKLIRIRCFRCDALLFTSEEARRGGKPSNRCKKCSGELIYEARKKRKLSAMEDGQP